MVICGGLEILAAGYLLNEFNKDKVEERERRKHQRQDSRPHSRPPNADNNRPSNHLQLPSQGPPRPLSAPPVNSYSAQWQQQQQPINPYVHQLQHIPQQQQQHFNQPPPWQTRFQGPPMPQQNQQHLQPQFIPNQGPSSAPGPGSLQRPNTFQPTPTPGPNSRPVMQASNTFPVQPPQQPFKPPPSGPLTYIDSKTGRVSHNLFPPDHPMARGMSRDDSELPRDLYGDDWYANKGTRDVKNNTGLEWSEKDEDDLAYGKDYSQSRRQRRRSISYERTRDRGRSSPPPRY